MHGVIGIGWYDMIMLSSGSKKSYTTHAQHVLNDVPVCTQRDVLTCDNPALVLLSGSLLPAGAPQAKW